MALTKDDLQGFRSVVRDEIKGLATKEGIAELAGMTKREFDCVHEALNVYIRRVEKVEERSKSSLVT